MNRTSKHLRAFSAMLASDRDIGALNTRHLQLLGLLCEQAEVNARPLSIQAVATLFGISHSTASRLAKRLAEDGYVRRDFQADDQHIAALHVTPKGVALNARIKRYYDDAAAIAA